MSRCLVAFRLMRTVAFSCLKTCLERCLVDPNSGCSKCLESWIWDHALVFLEVAANIASADLVRYLLGQFESVWCDFMM